VHLLGVVRHTKKCSFRFEDWRTEPFILLRMKTFAVIALIAATLGGCAGTPKSELQVANSGDPSDPHRVICKDSAAMTGSMLGGGRVCHTAAQWDQMEARAQAAVRQGIGQPGQGGGSAK
jgi:hypothetical protein